MLINYGSRGKLVKCYKDMLRALGFLKASTHDRFGRETLAAVKAFQRKNDLKADGIIGKKTGPAIAIAYERYMENGGNPPDQEIVTYLHPIDYPNVDKDILAAVNADLQDETPLRREMVAESLRWVFPYGLYVFGANLYKTDLEAQRPTPAYIDKMAKRNPEYFTGGRKDFMKRLYAEAVREKRRIACADCSGYMVGILRKLRIVRTGFDTTAYRFYHSYCKKIKKNALKPGDFVFKRNVSGSIPHMGMYLGAGYCVEAAGGAFGIQVSPLDDHILVDQMTHEKERRPAWGAYGDPTLY